jgi:RND family efflux transporter MFP subunit|tara:strand:- start:20620 stop:21666 length:1047 start_codon:yes stop_codon:yes gene_type:complete
MMKLAIKGLQIVLLVGWCQVTYASDAAAVVVRAVEEIVVGQMLPVTGIVQSRSDVLLSSTVEGELKWVVEQGSAVRANGVIATVDDAALQLRRSEQLLLAQRAKINLQFLSGEVDRLTHLRESNLASETQLAEMVSRRDLAGNDLAIAEARVEQIDEELTRCKIISPVAGIVAERLKQSGEFARRGESIARVVDTGHLQVRIAVPVTYRSRLRVGSLLSVEINRMQFDGNLQTIVHAGNESSQTFEALIDVPAERVDKVLDGQFAEVTVPLNQQGKSLVVPRDAVVLRREGNYVVLVDEDNHARRVSVTLGEGRGHLVAVDGDLQVGDRVAIRGMERLNDGQEVRPTT